MKLEDYLVLTRYLHHLLGADAFEDLQADLYPATEGPRGDGQSYFIGRLGSRDGLQLTQDELARYDRRVMQYEEQLRRHGRPIRFRYFQYLSLLYTEVYLDRLTRNPQAFLSDLNAFVNTLRASDPHLADFPAFTEEDLRRLAFFSATGSGKTLLMHIHLRQILHYMDEGRHPEALAKPLSGRKQFDHVLLITPNEGLSAQHLQEFAASGIPAVHLSEALRDPQRHTGHVKVVEIHKLAEEATGDGVSIPIGTLGFANLVFVDEGHKGTGSEAQTWKSRQKRLSQLGFLCEYSATFAQAIAAASKKAAEGLRREYGKAILFDYSYRYFYGDGYGKDFSVVNVSKGQESHAHELLMAGLLLFYQQHHLYRQHRSEARGTYNLAEPLWVFIGSSVNAVFSRDKQKQSDVATVVAFLRHVLSDEQWAVGTIGQLLTNQSALLGGDNEELFTALKGTDPEALYQSITRDLFGGAGALEVWEIKSADGEFGLRLSAPEGQERPYFGLINIGDTSAFKKHLRENLDIETQDDAFTDSLFEQVDASDASIKLLIGAKKFIEGWSSWRVSTMGLLNIGKGQGSQVIQLFGRGVRLKGKSMSLKRSSLEPGHPDWLEPLETLSIFGWNADYIEQFREMIEAEGITEEIAVPIRPFKPLPKPLYIPHPSGDYKATEETWTLEALPDLKVTLDRSPRVAVAHSAGGNGEVKVVAQQLASAGRRVPFDDGAKPYRNVLDWTNLYRRLLDYKEGKGFFNLFIPRGVLPDVLSQCCELLLPEGEWNDPARLQNEAYHLLCLYVDRYYARRERQAEGRHLVPVVMEPSQPPASDLLVPSYRLQASDADVLAKIKELIEKDEYWQDGGDELPRVHFDRHLYNPLLKEQEGLSIKPAPLNRNEGRLIEDVREFWRDYHNAAPYADLEVYLLRNLPRLGVGFYQRSGFYPDFILWVVDREHATQRVVFLEPHGMHHETQGLESEKLKALQDLRAKSQEQAFQEAGIDLDGYIITETPTSEIAGAIGKDKKELAEEHTLLCLSSQDSRKIAREWWVPFALGCTMQVQV